MADDVIRVADDVVLIGAGRRRRRRRAEADRAAAVAAGARRFGAAVFVLPLVHGATPRVHEEVAHRRRLQTQLFGYRHLHLFRRSFRLLITYRSGIFRSLMNQ